MKEDWKYKNIENIVKKYLLLKSVGNIFVETNRECGSCYSVITYSSTEIILNAHDDKGVPFIFVGSKVKSSLPQCHALVTSTEN